MMAVLCAAFMAPIANAQEVTYVEDPSQGYLYNRFKDNWFISGELGAGVMMSPYDSHMKFGKRIGWSTEIDLGKWFSPVFGVRLGVNASQSKGLLDPGHYTDMRVIGVREDLDKMENTLQQRFWNVGPHIDALINLTNWWCGYKKNRVYNAIFYMGIGAQFEIEKLNQGKGDWKGTGHHFNFRGGLLNTFALSKSVDFLLDLRMEYVQEYADGPMKTRIGYGTVLAGFAYKFNKRDWDAPITAVCPTWKYTDAEGDALAARLRAAEAKIADLEKQLRDCLNRKPQVIEQPAGPLATVYFPINKSNITGVQAKVVDAVANVMSDTDKNYVLTGWADNYTGTAARNVTLRKERVANVKKALVKKGVAENRLDAQINDGNLTNFGAKCASLDRAVTVQEAK